MTFFIFFHINTIEILGKNFRKFLHLLSCFRSILVCTGKTYTDTWKKRCVFSGCACKFLWAELSRTNENLFPSLQFHCNQMTSDKPSNIPCPWSRSSPDAVHDKIIISLAVLAWRSIILHGGNTSLWGLVGTADIMKEPPEAVLLKPPTLVWISSLLITEGLGGFIWILPTDTHAPHWICLNILTLWSSADTVTPILISLILL